jgi:hypothetical protein
MEIASLLLPVLLILTVMLERYVIMGYALLMMGVWSMEIVETDRYASMVLVLMISVRLVMTATWDRSA